MSRKSLSLVLFVLGAFLAHVHTTLPFLWGLVGIPWVYPLRVPQGALAMLGGFTPPIGAVLMVIGGWIYGRKTEEVAR